MVQSTHGRLKYLDLFSIVFHVFDNSYDNAHYQGQVGVALAKTVVAHLHEWYSVRGK